MHVLLVGEAPRRFSVRNFEWLRYTERALRRLGHTVTTFPCRESRLAASSSRQRVKAIPGLAERLIRYGEGLARSRDRRLIQLTRRLRPDLVVMLKGEKFSHEVLAEVKRLARGPLVTWWVDDPWRCPSFLQTFAVFDHVFIFDRSYMPRLREVGAVQVHFLPCACDETVYRPLQVSRSMRRRFSCDMAFVAWHFPERTPLVQGLAETVDIGVWGGQWDSLDGQRTPQGKKVVRGPAVHDHTANVIYNTCHIGLNVHQEQSRLSGLNTRAFELPACGTFQLVNWVEGIEALLEPDAEVVCYRSADEARRLAASYLADPAARDRIVARGRARVLEEHTYVHRLRALCGLAS